MIITIDTSLPLSETEKSALRMILIGGDPVTPAAAEAAPTWVPTPAPTPAPAPEPEADDATMEDAVQLATKLVSEGKAAQVKEALRGVGAKRVSELKGDAIATFIASLS